MMRPTTASLLVLTGTLIASGLTTAQNLPVIVPQRPGHEQPATIEGPEPGNVVLEQPVPFADNIPLPFTVLHDGGTAMFDPPALLFDGMLTFCPAEQLGDTMGAVTSGNPAAGEITFTYGTVVLQLKAGRSSVIRNGKEQRLDHPPRMYQGTLYVPLRPIATRLRHKVSYNPTDRVAEITSPAVPSLTATKVCSGPLQVRSLRDIGGGYLEMVGVRGSGAKTKLVYARSAPGGVNWQVTEKPLPTAMVNDSVAAFDGWGWGTDFLFGCGEILVDDANRSRFPVWFSDGGAWCDSWLRSPEIQPYRAVRQIMTGDPQAKILYAAGGVAPNSLSRSALIARLWWSVDGGLEWQTIPYHMIDGVMLPFDRARLLDVNNANYAWADVAEFYLLTINQLGVTREIPKPTDTHTILALDAPHSGMARLLWIKKAPTGGMGKTILSTWSSSHWTDIHEFNWRSETMDWGFWRTLIVRETGTGAQLAASMYGADTGVRTPRFLGNLKGWDPATGCIEALCDTEAYLLAHKAGQDQTGDVYCLRWMLK